MAPSKLLSRLLIELNFAAFAFFAAIPLHAAAATTIRVGYPQLNGGQTPLWNIADSKLDVKYNLDIKPVYIPGGVRLTQSMLSGAVDIAMTGGAAVNAMLSGAEFIYVGMPVATYAFSLYVRPEIKEVADLRGKVLGVITKGASSDHAAIALLRQYKMTQQDMKVLYFSRQEDALAALNQGIGVPHTRDFLLSGPQDVVAVAFPKNPIPYGALDGQPVHVMFFLFACDDRRHLHLLAKIPHLASQPESVALFRSHPTKEAWLAHVKDWEAQIKQVTEDC